ncbi:hypothetical protein [Kribbella catacumbae]|uniref:hypothetical protein n=1 Tax=Kribbella catacumbae TaxID=460086 RepID=UPI00035DE547|nr:hypothetical protein [Kribbella catacumbae]
MTSDPDALRTGPLDLPDLGTDRPDDAPEADVLDQRLPPAGSDADDEREDDYEVPADADPADVAEQHRSAGEMDDGDYR